MVKELRRIDVSNRPELKQLAEEVAKTGLGVVLRQNGNDLVTIMPFTARNRRKSSKPRTKEDVEAFQSAAGSWCDLDTEDIKRWIYEGRVSSKPPVSL